MAFNPQKFERPLSTESPEDKEIFRKASLMYDFDFNKDFNKYSQEDIDLLQTQSFAKIDGKYTLPDEIRNTIIKDKIGISNVPSKIRELDIKTDFSEHLVKTINNPFVNYKELSINELFYSNKLADLLPEQLNSREIQAELQRRQFFIPFQNITKDFAGRDRELQLLSDYVDWLPKEGVTKKLVGLFRNLINWHDKSPMLIMGIGGVGKSTLVSKFILDQNREIEGKNLPFVYIDFDLPGFTLKEPLTILIESLRQLSIQFVELQFLFDTAKKSISELIFNKSNKPNVQNENIRYQSSDGHARGFIYDSVEDLINNYGYDLNSINKPILIVFDSFEEMQYRASRDELNSFFAFIKEISEKIPRIRPVFVGRSEVSERIGDFTFDIVELNEFDEKSALILLQKYGIQHSPTLQKIYKEFGGNPLLLQLAADLIKKHPESIDEFDRTNAKKHEYLVNRILEHVHNSEVQKIAVPGMLVRTITPKIIEEVLAGPCKLGKINSERSQVIFNELQREAALISKSFDTRSIAFRQDLRIACEAMIWEQYPEASKAIRDNAITFYAQTKDHSEADEAEYYYHRFKRGDIPSEFDKKVYDRIYRYLEHSLIELPPKARQLINDILGSLASLEEIDTSSVVERESYYVSQIKRGLNNELGFLNNLYQEINRLSNYSNDLLSEFPFYKALLLQRLNRLEESDYVIDEALQSIDNLPAIDPLMFAELELLKIQNQEYKGNYHKALDLLLSSDIFHSIYISDSFASNRYRARVQEKYNFLYDRLTIRTATGPSTSREINVSFDSFLKKKSEDELFVDTFWEFIATVKHSQKATFKKADEFEKIQSLSRQIINNFRALETYCRSYLQAFSKDIALSGELAIVLQDFLYVLEIDGKIDTFYKELT